MNEMYAGNNILSKFSDILQGSLSFYPTEFLLGLLEPSLLFLGLFSLTFLLPFWIQWHKKTEKNKPKQFSLHSSPECLYTGASCLRYFFSHSACRFPSVSLQIWPCTCDLYFRSLFCTRETAQNITSDWCPCCGPFPCSMFMLLMSQRRRAGQKSCLEVPLQVKPHAGAGTQPRVLSAQWCSFSKSSSRDIKQMRVCFSTLLWDL